MKQYPREADRFFKKKRKKRRKKLFTKKLKPKNVHNICWPNSPSSRVHKQEWPMTGKTHTIKKSEVVLIQRGPWAGCGLYMVTEIFFSPPPASHVHVHVFTHATNDADTLSLKPCGLCVTHWVTHHLPHQRVRTNASTTCHAYALTPATVVCLVRQQLL